MSIYCYNLQDISTDDRATRSASSSNWKVSAPRRLKQTVKKKKRKRWRVKGKHENANINCHLKLLEQKRARMKLTSLCAWFGHYRLQMNRSRHQILNALGIPDLLLEPLRISRVRNVVILQRHECNLWLSYQILRKWRHFGALNDSVRVGYIRQVKCAARNILRRWKQLDALRWSNHSRVVFFFVLFASSFPRGGVNLEGVKIVLIQIFHLHHFPKYSKTGKIRSFSR